MSGTTNKVRVRRDVWSLDKSDKTLNWYRVGVGALQDIKDLSDPRAWIHLANIHGTTKAQSTWPKWLGVHGWNACQHASWHFLPWHRIYLHHFEKLILAAIVEKGGPTTWALPFWNYDPAKPTTLRLPPAFTEKGTAAKRNPLYVELRRQSMNDGVGMPTATTTINGWSDPFTTSALAIPTFGGPRTGWSHDGNVVGGLEDRPHGAIHMQVGGVAPRGLMSNFETAAQDPIFWLHHANIDRLWESWRGDAGHLLPAEAAWLDEPFEFGHGLWHTRLTARQSLDTTTDPLYYRYDGVAPAGGFKTPQQAVLGQPPVGGENLAMDRPSPTLAGASRTNISLAGAGPSRVPVRLEHQAARSAFPDTHALAPEAPKVYLALENVRASTLGPSEYEVHVGVPPDADPSAFPDLEAGRISTFGILEASGSDEHESGSGRTYSFDISQVVSRLSAEGRWDPANLQVAITPVERDDERTAEGDVEVGRIGVYYG